MNLSTWLKLIALLILNLNSGSNSDRLPFKTPQTQQIDRIMTNNPNNTPELDYLTRDFVRDECCIFGAVLSDTDCDRIIKEVKLLYAQGQFHHTGVYSIADYLAAQNLISPSF